MSLVESIDEERLLACFDQAMAQTFEVYFFSEALPKSGGQKPVFADLDGLEVELGFRGPFSGHLYLQVTRKTAAELVGSLPLPNLDDRENVINDLFAELTNTVGGRIVAALAGDDFDFDLTIPTVRLGPGQERSMSHSRVYETDFGPVLLSVSHLQENHAKVRKGA